MLNRQQFYQLQRILVILAIGFILLSATGDAGVYAFVSAPGRLFFYPQLIASLILATGGNLFMMALGAQQLALPERSIKQLLRTFGWLLVGIGSFTLLYDLGGLIQAESLASFNGHDWLITFSHIPPALGNALAEVLGFWLALPLLRLVAHHARATTINYLFWVQLGLVGMVPILSFLAGFTFHLYLPVTMLNGCFYALFGYWLSQRDWLRRMTRQQLLVAWLLTIGCYIVMVSVTLYRANLEGNLGVITEQTFAQTWQAIPCLTLWVTIATRVMNQHRLVSIRNHNFLAGSYGVLLMAGLLLHPLSIFASLFKPVLGGWWSSVLWVTITVIVSDWLIRICRLAPVLQRTLPALFFDTSTGDDQHAKTGSMD